ncbi:Facilitated trehalose transporter Tret1 [Chamberlinius hualienensis]
MGTVIFYPSVAFPDINSGDYGFTLSLSIMSWLASFAGLFALPGSILAVPLMDHFGRKFALIVTTLPMAIGYLLIVCSYNVITLGCGRAILGIAVGMIYSVAIVYLSEISPKNLRGTYGSLFAISVYFGGIYINLVGAFSNWRWMALGALAAVTMSSLSSLFMYETPRWLISKGHYTTASEIMRDLWHLKTSEEIDKEFKAIEINVKTTCSFKDGLQELLQAPLWKPLVITQVLMILQQFTGNAYINNYTVAIFQQATANMKITNEFLKNPKYQTLLVTLGYPIGGFLSIFFIDRFGRRCLLISSGILLTFTLAGLGTYYYLQTTEKEIASYLVWLPLTCLLLYVISFGFAFGGVPFLFASEVFPQHVRGVANGLVAFNHNLCYFIVVKVFPTIQLLPNYAIFWIYSSVALISVIFIIRFVPETKGKSLEEIQAFWTKKPKNNNLWTQQQQQPQKTAIVDYSVDYMQIQKLIKYTRNGNPTATLLALCSLSRFDYSVEPFQKAIFNTNGMELFLNILETDQLFCQVASLKLISTLSKFIKFRRNILILNGIETLIQTLSSNFSHVQRLSAEILAELLASRRAVYLLIQSNGVQALV